MSNKQAIDTLNNVLERVADKNPILLQLGKLYSEGGQFPEGLAAFQRVLQQDPSNEHALRGASRCAKEVGDNSLIETYNAILTSLGVFDESEPVAQSQPAAPSLNLVHNTGAPQPDNLASTVVDIISAKKVRLSDVAGLANVKKRIELSFLSPIKNPALAEKYNVKKTSGLLLYGPPGCGKTYIASALAGEMDASFISIGINDILDMWVGNSEKNLAGAFDEARRKAPCVLFFDELDALGHARGGSAGSSTDNTVNQMLAEMDGIDQRNEGVFTLGATNIPWKVDSALRRPGRFDRTIFVPPPDEIARQKLFDIHLKDRPVENIDVRYFVKKTNLYSGADIRQICDLATELCLEKAMDSGIEKSISNKEMKTALKDTQSTVMEWFNTAKNYVAFSNTSGTFDDVADYMRSNKLL